MFATLQTILHHRAWRLEGPTAPALFRMASVRANPSHNPKNLPLELNWQLKVRLPCAPPAKPPDSKAAQRRGQLAPIATPFRHVQLREMIGSPIWERTPVGLLLAEAYKLAA
jgi:hypothetical protein